MLLKAKLLAVGGAAFAILLVVLKVLTGQLKAAKKQVKIAKAKIKFDSDVQELDAEIEQEFSHRAQEANGDEVPDNLSDPDNF